MYAIFCISALFCLIIYDIWAMTQPPESNTSLVYRLKYRFQFYPYAYIKDKINNETNCLETCKTIGFYACKFKPKFYLEERGLNLTIDAANGTEVFKNNFEINSKTNDLSAESIEGCFCQKSDFQELKFLYPKRYGVLKMQGIIEMLDTVMKKVVDTMTVFAPYATDLPLNITSTLVNGTIEALRLDKEEFNEIQARLMHLRYIQVPGHQIDEVRRRMKHHTEVLRKTLISDQEKWRVRLSLVSQNASISKMEGIADFLTPSRELVEDLNQLDFLLDQVIQPPKPFTSGDVNTWNFGVHSCDHGFVSTMETRFSVNEVLLYSHIYVNDLVNGKRNCLGTCKETSPYYCEATTQPQPDHLVGYVEKYKKKLGIFHTVGKLPPPDQVNTTCHCVNSLPRRVSAYLRDTLFLSDALLALTRHAERILDGLTEAVEKAHLVCASAYGICAPDFPRHVADAIRQLDDVVGKYKRFRRTRHFQTHVVPDRQVYDDVLKLQDGVTMRDLEVYARINENMEVAYEHILRKFGDVAVLELRDPETLREYTYLKAVSDKSKKLILLMLTFQEMSEKLETRVKAMRNAYDAFPAKEADGFSCPGNFRKMASDTVSNP